MPRCGRGAPLLCPGPVRFKRRCRREVMTAVGAIHLERSHGYCKGCEQPRFAADRLLGVNGWLTPRARGVPPVTRASPRRKESE
jgi:hypothetical protein